MGTQGGRKGDARGTQGGRNGDAGRTLRTQVASGASPLFTVVMETD